MGAPVKHSLLLTPQSPGQTQGAGKGTRQSQAELRKLRRGHTGPCFRTKKFNKYDFSKFIARNNTSKMYVYVRITLRGQYKGSSRS